jgi:ribosome biogenesis GTPase
VKQGLVIKVAGSLYSVKDTDGIIVECRIKGKLRTRDLKSTNPITVGDVVKFDLINDVGSIHEIEERKNYIIRKSTNLSKQHHIIAANIDQAILIVTLKDPETNTDFIDRYLVSAEAFNIPVILVFNKVDLLSGDSFEYLKYLTHLYKNIGYQCIETSVPQALNIDKLLNILQNKITVVNGNSGVGKSSLINAIDSDLNLKIGKISDFHQTGMHTTSYSEMFELKFGGYIIDTPGIKAFGLIDFSKEELYHYFPEIFKIAENCKFYNCTHIHEPGCEVIKAMDEGRISLTRYTSYFNMFSDDNNKHRS